MTTPSLEDGDRYARHIALPQVGAEGQRRIASGRVLVVGAGGLGSPVLLYLAAAGVGSITVIDDDTVSISNLQRQVVHDTARAGDPKVESARARMVALNPGIAVTAVAKRIDSTNAASLVSGADVVVDGSDSFETRFALSDACAAARIPYVYGSVQGFEGQASLLCDADAPCYRCLFPEPPPPGTVPACREAGVLGTLPGIVGTIQATEVLKVLAGIGETLRGRLLLIDGLHMRFHEVALRRNPDCRACGRAAGARERTMDVTAATREDATMDAHADMSPAELRQRLDAGDSLVVIDVREPAEWEIGHIEGARHLPMGRVQAEVASLDPTAEMVVYCHHGSRSGSVAGWLRRSGFTNVHNLAGGIDRWSVEVDPAVARY
ncbi:MAG: molybdopterin-synthase adenylyltransferase MoeB [Gemmatimonadaceae bacterium]|nr:molybdopterin-synthase adenylyltransferase MoeB [Gemmatimonadaceae bacterium]